MVAASFEVALQPLPHLKTLRTQMQSAFEPCVVFLAQETLQDQYIHVKIVDRVAFNRSVFFSDLRLGTFEQFSGASQVIYVFEYLL